MMKDKNAS